MRIVPILLLLVLLSACTIGDPKPTASPPAMSAGPASATPAGTAAATPSPLPVVASRTTSLFQQRATVSLNEVRVRDGVTTVTWTVTNDETEGVGMPLTNVLGHSWFSDGQRARMPGTDDNVPDDLSYADGVFLVDAVNKLRYLPARDAQGVCVCSRTSSTNYVAPGGAAALSAVFQAIPDGVVTVAVSIPNVGAFSDVAVQR